MHTTPSATPATAQEPTGGHLTLITGSSRGLGEALAAQCLRLGHRVIGIARQRSTRLDDLAQSLGAPLQQWQQDLAAPEPAAWALLDWLQAQPATGCACVTLINNAGMLVAPEPLEGIDPAESARVLRVGLEAPLLLTSLFLRGTSAWSAQRRVLNISSGLGRRAMAGSAAYCAAKAGLDHFTRAIALEQATQANGAAVVSLAPGVIDTDMQVQLREGDPTRFPDQPQFAALHAEGKLTSPEAAAARILNWLARPDFGQQPVADVRSP